MGVRPADERVGGDKRVMFWLNRQSTNKSYNPPFDAMYTIAAPTVATPPMITTGDGPEPPAFTDAISSADSIASSFGLRPSYCGQSKSDGSLAIRLIAACSEPSFLISKSFDLKKTHRVRDSSGFMRGHALDRLEGRILVHIKCDFEVAPQGRDALVVLAARIKALCELPRFDRHSRKATRAAHAQSGGARIRRAWSSCWNDEGRDVCTEQRKQDEGRRAHRRVDLARRTQFALIIDARDGAPCEALNATTRRPSLLLTRFGWRCETVSRGRKLL